MRKIFLLLISFFLLSGCFLLPKEEALLAPPIMEPPEITYRTTAVRRGEIEDSIRITGYFVYAEQYGLSFKSMSGRLKSIDVDYTQIVEKGQILAQLDTDNLRLTIKQEELQVRKAELLLEKLKLTGADKYELEISGIDLELAKLGLQQLRNDLERAQLRSPIRGEIVYIANVLEGDFVDSYKTIAQVADKSKLYLSYSGGQLQDFRLGMKVKIIFMKQEYAGEVVMTPAEFPYDAPDSVKRQVLFSIYEFPENARKGDSGLVYLILDKRDDTLIIPRSQVQHYMGRKYVYILEDGIRSERNIETGIQNATEIEVVRGLVEGELLVLR